MQHRSLTPSESLLCIIFAQMKISVKISALSCALKAIYGILLTISILLPAAAEEPGELIVWGIRKDRGLEAALRQFEVEHPGWEVVTSAGSSGGMDPQKLMCGIAGGSAPDMLQQDRFSVGEWAVRDAFLPLDARVAHSLVDEDLAVQTDSLLAAGHPIEALVPLRQLIGSLEERSSSRQLDLGRQLAAGIEAGGGGGAALAALAGELRVLCQGIHLDKFFTACREEASFGRGEQRRVFAIPNSTDERALY